jgi:uncharacterized protein (TIGR02679 family)
VTPSELRALLGRPELDALFQSVRDALEARGPEGARSLTLTGLSREQRQAIADLHGWQEVPSGERVRISLARLDGALRESAVGQGVVEVITALYGPLVDRRTARAEAVAAREEQWQRARARLEAAGRIELLSWLDELRALGLVARAASLGGVPQAELLDRALTVALRLPSPGILLPVLATELFGDAHALDVGRPEAGLALRAAVVLAGWSAPPASAPERRRLWAEVGVACDPLSTDVLTLGLHPVGEGLLTRHLRECSAAGEPRRVTLRELMRGSVAVVPRSTVLICENPSVVAAAADEHGARCAAIVCVEGVPSTAALLLLRQLEASGAALGFHTDFDWPGVRIANRLAAHLPSALPWRMAAGDYEAAAGSTNTIELAGLPVAATWDPALTLAMSRRGVAVYEESVLSELLEDAGRESA